MLGAAKVVGLAKALPLAGAAIEGAEATRRGAALLSSGKAAAVGAVAFDPNGARLSDLVALQGPSWLQNPVTSYLAHTRHEDDTPALGRMKNALESIGVDAAIAGVFALSVKGYAKVQAYRAGSATAEEVQAATDELAHAVAHKDAKLAAHQGDTETLAALRETHPEATAQAEASLLPPPVEAGTEVTMKPDGTAEVTLPELRTESSAAGTLDTAIGTNARPAPLLEVSDEQVSRLMAHGEADTAALMGAALQMGDRRLTPRCPLSCLEDRCTVGHHAGRRTLGYRGVLRAETTLPSRLAGERGGHQGPQNRRDGPAEVVRAVAVADQLRHQRHSVCTTGVYDRQPSKALI